MNREQLIGGVSKWSKHVSVANSAIRSVIVDGPMAEISDAWENETVFRGKSGFARFCWDVTISLFATRGLKLWRASLEKAIFAAWCSSGGCDVFLMHNVRCQRG